MAADEPPDDLLLHDRADATHAVNQPRHRHGVLLAGDLHRGRAAQQRVRAIEHEPDEPEPHGHRHRAAAEMNDRRVTRNHPERHDGPDGGPVAPEPPVQRPAGQKHTTEPSEIEHLRVVARARNVQPLHIQERRQPRVQGVAQELDAEVACAHRQDNGIGRQLRVLLERDVVFLRGFHGVPLG